MPERITGLELKTPPVLLIIGSERDSRQLIVQTLFCQQKCGRG
jgi:hypothetical protein